MLDKKFIIIGGVTGSGKTTIAQALALKLNYEFKDADDFHSEANKMKMAQAIPLTTEDRLPWLATLSRLPEQYHRLVLACSALKKEYRQMLASNCESFFIILNVPRDILEDRVRRREGHYAKVDLIESQLRTLEIPTSEEKNTAIVENIGPVQEVVDRIIKVLEEKGC